MRSRTVGRQMRQAGARRHRRADMVYTLFGSSLVRRPRLLDRQPLNSTRLSRFEPVVARVLRVSCVALVVTWRHLLQLRLNDATFLSRQVHHHAWLTRVRTIDIDTSRAFP